ncbi:hypothetical protein [Afifella pfennigii]|uniref:hypothetical protein n=1 Tax=Afifella pfennigii TaxID=209897 RepID=UPI00047D2739|nr:hypothetical protein [Afifella pfennigii]
MGSASPGGGTPLWKLFLLLYPFTAAAVAVNLFMLSLMWQPLGLPVLSPLAAILGSSALGLPATWLAARWVRHLLTAADKS